MTMFNNVIDMLVVQGLMVASGVVGYLVKMFSTSSVITSIQSDIASLQAKVTPSATPTVTSTAPVAQ